MPKLPIFHTTFNDTNSLINPYIGPQGIVDNPSNFVFSPCYFNNGITESSNYSRAYWELPIKNKTGLTIEMWIKAIYSGNEDSFPIIIGNNLDAYPEWGEESNSIVGWIAENNISSFHRTYMISISTQESYVEGTTSIFSVEENEIYHIAFVINLLAPYGEKVKIYKNGIEMELQYYGENSPPLTSYTFSKYIISMPYWHISSWGGWGATFYYKNIYDNLKIYDYAKTNFDDRFNEFDRILRLKPRFNY